ncbi:hypothetical protein GT347_22675 [Xylophilus rhododendri]|uniref:DUF2782 domain-containing protein n=1 Tax=Xylophilus rhododendri TaxID=2697032 RepID=A0A857JBJ2_9BURK|nr:hypothetical protein [Xylophilus rhododendri]QHJ00532.1 hypothetical protein GT347_22675 [Xylophilus rhododendri]
MSALPLLRPAAILAAALAFSLLASDVRAEELVEGPEPRTPRVEQKVEHLHVGDEGTSIDEVRYGGRTQSITVQPRGAKEYDVQPTDGARRRASEREGGDANGGARTWKMIGF